MPARQKKPPASRDGELPPLPVNDETWQAIVERLKLSPQQARIVALILRRKQDKDIAEELGLSVPTVRTYLKRIFDRTNVTDRLGLVLHIFAVAQELARERHC